MFLSLEAPARNASTRAWLSGAEEAVIAIATDRANALAAAGAAKLAGGTSVFGGLARAVTASQSEQPLPAVAAPPTIPPPPAPTPAPLIDDVVLYVLPRFFAFSAWKCALIRLDVSNAQLRALAPYLANSSRGAEYELTRFNSAVERGEVSTTGVTAWLSVEADGAIERAAGPAAAGVAALVRGAARLTRLALIRDGVVRLLESSQPLTQVAGQGGGAFPETFLLDAHRLRDVQDLVQRVALVSTLTGVVNQLHISSPSAPPSDPPRAAAVGPSTLAEFSVACNAWLRDPAITFNELFTGVLGAADAINRRGGKVGLLPEGSPGAGPLVSTLRAAVTNSLSATHPLFVVFSKRLRDVIRRRLTRVVTDTLPSGSADALGADGNPLWSECLDPVGAALPPTLAAALPPACESELAVCVSALARVVVFNEAVFGETLYRGLLSGAGTTAPTPVHEA